VHGLLFGTRHMGQGTPRVKTFLPLRQADATFR
jgi:hypothetical protein